MDRRQFLGTTGALCAAGATAAISGCTTGSGHGTLTVVESTSDGAPPPSRIFKSAAGQPYTPQPYTPQLGRGFDTVQGRALEYVFTGEEVESRITPDGLYHPEEMLYRLTEDQRSYSALKSQSAKAKGRYGLFKGQGRFNSDTSEASDSYSLHICAIARRVKPSVEFKRGTLALLPEFAPVFRRRATPDGKLTSLYGDAYVAGVTPVAELFIDAKIECSSETEKKSVSASIKAGWGGFGSAKGSFSEVIEKAQSSKSVEMIVTGSNKVTKPLTSTELEAILTSFFSDDDVPHDSELTVRNSDGTIPGRDWINNRDLNRRRAYAASAASFLHELDLIYADSRYVARKPDQFEAAVFSQAAHDLDEIRATGSLVEDAIATAFAEFDDSGITGRAFDERFQSLGCRYKGYPQKSDPPPSPVPNPVPTPEATPQRRPRWSRGQDGPRGTNKTALCRAATSFAAV